MKKDIYSNKWDNRTNRGNKVRRRKISDRVFKIKKKSFRVFMSLLYMMSGMLTYASFNTGRSISGLSIIMAIIALIVYDVTRRESL